MLTKSRFIHFGSCAALGLSLTSCIVEDPANKREKVELEEWSTGPDGTTYNYTKCEVSSPRYLATFCGQKPGNPETGVEATPYTYNWNSNCKGDQCAIISVFAHYDLSTDLGEGQTLHIEAFDNPEFHSNPVASLDIVGFDTSRPNSTDREEIYLAPGEYYFRAFIAPDGGITVPYAFQGMQLVGGQPVGYLGAASGAERIVIDSSKDQQVIHISIDQLYKKPQAEADSLAKLRLQISVDPNVIIPHSRDLHIVLSSDAKLETTPSYDFTLSTNELLVTEQENQADFVSPSLNPGDYYVFTYVDGNGNGFADPEEAAAFVLDDEEPAVIKIEKNRIRNAKVEILGKTLATK